MPLPIDSIGDFITARQVNATSKLERAGNWFLSGLNKYFSGRKFAVLGDQEIMTDLPKTKSAGKIQLFLGCLGFIPGIFFKLFSLANTRTRKAYSITPPKTIAAPGIDSFSKNFNEVINRFNEVNELVRDNFYQVNGQYDWEAIYRISRGEVTMDKEEFAKRISPIIDALPPLLKYVEEIHAEALSLSKELNAKLLRGEKLSEADAEKLNALSEQFERFGDFTRDIKNLYVKLSPGSTIPPSLDQIEVVYRNLSQNIKNLAKLNPLHTAYKTVMSASHQHLSREFLTSFIDMPPELWMETHGIRGDTSMHTVAFNFAECACLDNEWNRLRNNQRSQAEAGLMRSLTERIKDKNQPISILSLGSGKLLQEFIILGKLIKAGYRKVRFVLIDPIYPNKSLEEFRRLCEAVTKANICNIEIESFEYGIDYLAKHPKDGLDAILAIDYEPENYELDAERLKMHESLQPQRETEEKIEVETEAQTDDKEDLLVDQPLVSDSQSDESSSQPTREPLPDFLRAPQLTSEAPPQIPNRSAEEDLYDIQQNCLKQDGLIHLGAKTKTTKGKPTGFYLQLNKTQSVDGEILKAVIKIRGHDPREDFYA